MSQLKRRETPLRFSWPEGECHGRCPSGYRAVAAAYIGGGCLEPQGATEAPCPEEVRETCQPALKSEAVEVSTGKTVLWQEWLVN